MASSLPSLRQVAPRLTRHLFQRPRQCLNPLKGRPMISPSSLSRGRGLRGLRTSTIQNAAATGDIWATASPAKVPDTPALSHMTKAGKAKAHKHFFPETSEKPVAYWLLGSAASVFGLVVFGGLTRLTESGLSITEWRPVTGTLPPFGQTQWESEFAKYQASPEFALLNPNMTMVEFKKIYYMEWTHRLWGRLVGASFIIPAVYFIARGKVSKSMALKITGIGGLIGFQGFLGWWMVKSGLKDDLFTPGSHPRVSQYRLVAHLGTAFICYSAMLWNGLQILQEQRLLSGLSGAINIMAKLRNPGLRAFQVSSKVLAGLVFVTAMSGGFVAGLDAGLIYNDFPWMGERWIPPLEELFSDFYSKKADARDLWWRNALENPSLAQLDHRILASTTFGAIVALFAYSKFSRKARALLPRASRKAMHGVLGFACLQVTLGITTLLYLVPLPLASAHQAGSLALLSYMLILGSRTWLPRRRFAALLAKRVAQSGPANARAAIKSPHLHPRHNVFKAFPALQK